MPRDRAITFGDGEGKLVLLRFTSLTRCRTATQDRLRAVTEFRSGSRGDETELRQSLTLSTQQQTEYCTAAKRRSVPTAEVARSPKRFLADRFAENLCQRLPAPREKVRFVIGTRCRGSL